MKDADPGGKVDKKIAHGKQVLHEHGVPRFCMNTVNTLERAYRGSI
jgi:hypothetical protein